MRNNGFAFFGIFSQIAAGFPDNGLVLITTGNTADLYAGDTVICDVMERFYHHLLPNLSDLPLPEDSAALDELLALSAMPQMTAPGASSSPTEGRVSGHTYALYPNKSGWLNARFEFSGYSEKGDTGKLVYTNRRGAYEIDFGMGYNIPFIFSDFNRLYGSERTECEAHGSAAWIDNRTLALYLYFTEEEESYLRLNAVFDGNRLTILIKQGEGNMRQYGGYMYGYWAK